MTLVRQEAQCDMNKAALRNALQEVISSRKSSSLIFQSSEIDVIEKSINLDPALKQLDGNAVTLGVGSTAFIYSRDIAWALCRYAQETSPARAVSDLEKFINNKTSQTKLVMVISGIDVVSEFDIGNNLVITPFKSVPASRSKDLFTNWKTWVSHYDFFGRNTSEPPENNAVLIKSFPSRLIIDQPQNIDKHAYISDRDQLRQVALALSLYKDFSVVEIATWLHIENEKLNVIMPNRAGYSPASDLPIADSNKKLGKRNIAGIRALIERFDGLEHDSIQHLRISIERLVRARRHSNLTDKAIDLGISLEALLGDANGGGEITYKLSVRGARLIARATKKRSEIKSLLTAIYRLRSKAVHTGRIPARTTIAGKGKTPTHEVLKMGSELCGDLLRKCVTMGGKPSWDDFDLR